MTTKSAAVAAVAAAVIGGSIYHIVRTQSPAEREPSQEAQYWHLLASEGRVVCPHCDREFLLTDEQRKAPEPPELTCPHCGKAFDPGKPPPSKPAGGSGSPAKMP